MQFFNAINQVDIGREKEVAVAVILERIAETLDDLGVEQAYGRIRRGTNLTVIHGGKAEKESGAAAGKDGEDGSKDAGSQAGQVENVPASGNK